MIASTLTPVEQAFSPEQSAPVADLSSQLTRLQAQLAAQAALIQQQQTLIAAQSALLDDIRDHHIVIQRNIMAVALPKLTALPAAARDAFMQLLADTDPDGVTATAWTGVAMGEALGLKRAVRERVIGPLEAAGLAMQVGAEGRKGRRYTLAVVTNNALAERINSLPMRCHSALSELSNQATADSNALPERVNSSVLRSQSALIPPNALSQRITRPLVCLYRSTDPDLSEDPQTNSPAVWPWSATRGISNAWSKMGLTRTLKAELLRLEPERALALVHHARIEATRNPAGLLNHMLQKQASPGQRHWEWARSILSSPADIPSPDETAELKRHARPTCPDCHGRGWVERNWDPAVPWGECSCVDSAEGADVLPAAGVSLKSARAKGGA